MFFCALASINECNVTKGLHCIFEKRLVMSWSLYKLKHKMASYFFCAGYFKHVYEALLILT